MVGVWRLYDLFSMHCMHLTVSQKSACSERDGTENFENAFIIGTFYTRIYPSEMSPSDGFRSDVCIERGP